jgi:thiol-disulfide isomerase/thioredoxin
LKHTISGIALTTTVLCLTALSVSAQLRQSGPQLDLKDIQGRSLHLSDYKGKVVLVNFWATWCPPCRREIPDLIKWQRQYRARGLQVIGITYPPETLSEVRRFARKMRVNYPLALGSKETRSLFGTSETLPITVVIDKDGIAHEVIEGILFSDEFDAKVKPLLSDMPPSFATMAATQKRGRVQTATIQVSGEGYEPTNIKLRKGIPARLTFIRRVAAGCGTEIVIPAYGINRPLPLNQPVTVSFTPQRTGRIKMTCGMDMFRGSLVVR